MQPSAMPTCPQRARGCVSLLFKARGCVSLLFKLRFLQDPQGEEQGLAAMSKMADVKVNELHHEEILSNFDSFLKLAGNELGSVRDLAKNMTGRHPDQVAILQQPQLTGNGGGGEILFNMTSRKSFFRYIPTTVLNYKTH